MEEIGREVSDGKQKKRFEKGKEEVRTMGIPVYRIPYNQIKKIANFKAQIFGL